MTREGPEGAAGWANTPPSGQVIAATAAANIRLRSSIADTCLNYTHNRLQVRCGPALFLPPVALRFSGERSVSPCHAKDRPIERF
jgi:hypothetical protein